MRRFLRWPLASMTVYVLVSAPAHAQEPRTIDLGQALSELDGHNLALGEAVSRVAQARALVGQSTSALLPTVLAAGGYTRNSDEARVALGGLFQSLGLQPPPGAPGNLYIQPREAWTVSGSVRVPLLAPSAWAERAATQRGAESAAAGAQSLRLQLRAGVLQIAYAAAAGEEIVSASERAVAVARAHRDTAARRANAGEEARLSVLKADTEVVRRESDLVRARAELDRTRLAMGVLLGRAEPVRVLAPSPAQLDVPWSESLVSEALAARPELRADAAKIRAAEAQTLAARLRLLPQLSGTATVFASDMPYPTGKKDGWRITLDATWLLFDGGYRSSRRSQAEAETESARSGAEAAHLSVAQEVSDAVRDVGVARERLRLAERQAAFAAEAAASAKRTFEGGIAGSLEVLDANDRLYQADVAVAEARGRFGAARAGLSKALGRDVAP
jgi:outer membrane protein TolC